MGAEQVFFATVTGVVIGAGLMLLARWIDTRHDQEIDLERSVLISTAEYRELLLMRARCELSQADDKEKS